MDSELPVERGAAYVTHHSLPEKYEDKVDRWLKLHNFVADLELGQSFNYPGYGVEKVDAVTYWDPSNRALYMPWATDLLPGEVHPVGERSPRQINYVGTVNHDGILPRFKAFSDSALRAGYKVRVFEGVSNQRAMELAIASKLVIDIRGDWHLQRGYVPCRIWKALSYGRAVTSNSPKLAGVFGDRIALAPEGQDLFGVALRHESQSDAIQARENQNWVMKNHTFVNRARAILELL